VRYAFRMFGPYVKNIVDFFPDIKKDLKKANLKYSVEEYISLAIFTTLIVFVAEMPIFSFIYGILFEDFLFSFVFSFTTSGAIAMLFLYLFSQYPKLVAKQRASNIDDVLPFAIIHFTTILKSKIPLHEAIKILSQFKIYKEFWKEISLLSRDIFFFGLDVATSLERATERCPSKKMTEVLWGILSNFRAGTDIVKYLEQKSRELMEDYRRRLYEFAHTLSIYIEVYLTAIVIGSIFFIILTAIFTSISGVGQDVILLQFLLIFALIPAISMIFMLMVKKAAPGGEV